MRSERYFVINWYKGKGNYWKADWVKEYPTHEKATAQAYMNYLTTIDLSGDDEGERWEVFVGSKTKLDRMLKKWQTS